MAFIWNKSTHRFYVAYSGMATGQPLGGWPYIPSLYFSCQPFFPTLPFVPVAQCYSLHLPGYFQMSKASFGSPIAASDLPPSASRTFLGNERLQDLFKMPLLPMAISDDKNISSGLSGSCKTSTSFFMSFQRTTKSRNLFWVSQVSFYPRQDLFLSPLIGVARISGWGQTFFFDEIWGDNFAFSGDIWSGKVKEKVKE